MIRSTLQRPRLAEQVLARRHVVDGHAYVVLFDGTRGGVFRIEPHAWAVLTAADGTRDLEGVVRAARRLGVVTSLEDTARFLGDLAARGLVEDVPPDPPPEPRPEIEVQAGPAPRALRLLPRWTMVCDRSGRCCAQYGSVIATLAEAERARVVCPDRRVGPLSGPRLFTPMRGSAPMGAVAIACKAGACAYLDDDGGCALHRSAGAKAKPAGCRLFPSTFVDDGESVRVSVKLECGCVLDSDGRTDGSPLVEGDEPPAEAVVVQVPERIELGEGHSVSRAEARAWTDAFSQPDGDLACALWTMGADAGLPRWRPATAPPAVDEVRPAALELARRAVLHARRDAQWRAETDRARVISGWVALTLTAIADAEILAELLRAGADRPAHEALYVRASIFDMRWLVDGPLGQRLRDAALRLWIARAMTTFAPSGDVGPPLPALESCLRGYGLAR